MPLQSLQRARRLYLRPVFKSTMHRRNGGDITMQEVAEFQKVSFTQFLKDSQKTGFIDSETSPELIKLIWEKIKLPVRATAKSAGYDFFLPFSFSVYANGALTIPTGIKANIDDGWYLMLVPRSSLGFKHGLRLLNTCGIIDADFTDGDTEGHILAKITVDRNMCLQEGDRFIQGILVQHGITKDDNPTCLTRSGGFGSTGK